MIYFDNAATTKPNKKMLDIYLSALEKVYNNPSSTHRFGTEGEKILKKARKQCAAYLPFVSVKEDEIIFTSGATESNNLAIKGVARRYKNKGRHLVTTKAEHPSVLNSFKDLEDEGFEVTYLNVSNAGIDLDELERALRKDTILVSIMAVNNEIGAIYDIASIASITKKRGILFHVDATQALYKVDIDYSLVDLLSFSAHKLGGLKGTGLLIKRQKVDLVPLFSGGEQEWGYRSGTSNIPGAIALAATLRLAANNYHERVVRATALKNYLAEELKKIPSIIITSPPLSSPFILSFILKEHKASVVVEALSLKDIMVSTKSACSSKKIGGSTVLRAYGYSEEEILNGIRLSFSGYEEMSEAKIFIQELDKILRDTRRTKHD